MTDTEGTEARRSDGEETQFIQPIRDYGRAETKPLDLPRATIGGYRADAVERRVAELERRRALDQAEIIRLKRENHARQTENGELNQRLTMLREQNKKLEYQASNPYEHIGVDMQNMVNGAKAERKAILDKAETEARTILGKARAKAETLTAEAKKKRTNRSNRPRGANRGSTRKPTGESAKAANRRRNSCPTPTPKPTGSSKQPRRRPRESTRGPRQGSRTPTDANTRPPTPWTRPAGCSPTRPPDSPAPCRNSRPRTPANRTGRRESQRPSA